MDAKTSYTFCVRCRRALWKAANPGPSGCWYHNRNGSVFCYPGTGRGEAGKAVPKTVTK